MSIVLLLGGILTLAAPQPAAATDTSAAWMHVLYTVGDLAARPPQQPLVVLLGGSVARESTISDTDWAAQVLRRGGPEVVTRNLATTHQTLAQDRWLVNQFPPVPTIVFIGMNVGRFTASPNATFAKTPSPYGTYVQHRYEGRPILSVERKRQIVRDWMKKRYPVFKQRYSYNLRMLDECIQRCLARGLRPVLLDLPRNTAVIGHAFDVPVKRYHADMKRLAATYDIRFINFVYLAKLLNRDFFDIGHLVKSGRVKWQRLLSDRTITLLSRYGIGATVAGGSGASD